MGEIAERAHNCLNGFILRAAHQSGERMEFQKVPESGKHILLSKEPPIATVQLNRPDVLNALNHALMSELTACLEQLDSDNSVNCIVLTGNEKAFAAGADISEMSEASAVEMLTVDNFRVWDRIRKIKKPLIAAVSGFALGRM